MKAQTLSLAIVALSLTACGDATHLVYIHNANLGLEVTPVVQAGGTARFSLGYDRETFALVPRRGKAEDGADAMSLAAFSRVKSSGGLKNVQFAHVIATGNAAVSAVADPTKLQETTDKFFKKPEGDQ